MTDFSQEFTEEAPDNTTDNTDLSVIEDGRLIEDIRELIESSKSRFANAANAANAALVMLYWNVGKRINAEILGNERAEYGKEIVHALSGQLTNESGSGFKEKKLRPMIQFAGVFPDKQIVVSLTRQLSWTHFITFIPPKDPIQRVFYAEMCRVERWSTTYPAYRDSDVDKSGGWFF